VRQATNLVQLFKDFSLLIIRAEELLLEENIKDFLVDCENVPLHEAEQILALNYIDLINETKEYAKELRWYIDNHQESIMNRAHALQKLTFYRKRSLSGLKTIKNDMDTTPFEDRRQHLTKLLNSFIIVFNDLLATAREEIQETPISQQTNWVDLYELSDITIDAL
jgi:hypothetical protein